MSVPVGAEIRRLVVTEGESGLRAGEWSVLVILQRLKLETKSKVVLAFRPEYVVLYVVRVLRFIEGVRVGAIPTDGRIVAIESDIGKTSARDSRAEGR